METPNLMSMVQALREQGVEDDGVVRMLRTFNVGAPFVKRRRAHRRADGERTPQPPNRTLKVDYIARVEGEGAM